MALRRLLTKAERLPTSSCHCRINLCTKADDWPVVRVRDVERFIEECMTKVGTRPAHAASLARNLVAADHRGHYSHGLNRLSLLSHSALRLFLFAEREREREKHTLKLENFILQGL